jgi:hydroxypyruvate reductase
MSLEGDVLRVGSQSFADVVPDDIVIVAIGKAAAGMAIGAHDTVGASRGIVVTTHASNVPYPLIVGSHPIPDEMSMRCGNSLLALVAATQPSDVVVFLVSGGGSAVAVAPVDGVSIEDLAEMNRILIASGMPIEDINAVRASVSRIKGGGLTDAANTERRATLILSDVVGASPAHVASGPSTGFGFGSTPTLVIDTYGLRTELPGSVVAAIERSPDVEERPASTYDVIGSPEIAANAALAFLRSGGFDASIATTNMVGESRSEAVALVDRTSRGTITVAAGETTVAVCGGGIGGRNQEAALAAAIHIDGRDVVFVSLGTDGIDGPTEAAGAVVNGATASKARDLGLDLDAALGDNDSHTVLTVLGETVVTGPSGTNVADLWMVAKGPFPEDS